ncbi:hypothetical protein R3P38DRAFT_2416811, partial [Favolaschia claudopus]
QVFAFLETRYTLPWDTTVRNTLAQIYIDMYICFELTCSQEIKSKIAVSTDTWTSRAMTSTFPGFIGSWISSDWELIERLIECHPIQDLEHEG